MAFGLASGFAPPPSDGIFSFVPVLAPLLARMAEQGGAYLEWGMGRSTRMALQAGIQVVSVEHDPHWFNYFMDEHRGHPNLTAHLLADLDQYVAIARTAPANTGLIFVDGVARPECLVAASQVIPRLASRCDVLLHDARDPAYVDAIGIYQHTEYPEGDTDTLLLTL
ncbi:MAG: class I SAM-dependent methyltransferase [bacterium]|nr:class I SAM-dependent methyltransferase [bacterium]